MSYELNIPRMLLSTAGVAVQIVVNDCAAEVDPGFTSDTATGISESRP